MSEGAVLRDLEVRHRAAHGQGLLLGHGLAGEVAQGVVDRLPLGLQVVAHHDNLDQRVIDINVGSRHVEDRTPSWCIHRIRAAGAGCPYARPVIRSFQSRDIDLEMTPLNDARNPNGDVSTGVRAVTAEGDMEVGVWQHSVGTSTDTEIEEVFVVIEGEGTVTCSEGGRIDLAPGVVGLLPAGARTTWTVTTPLRKVWITLR